MAGISGEGSKKREKARDWLKIIRGVFTHDVDVHKEQELSRIRCARGQYSKTGVVLF